MLGKLLLRGRHISEMLQSVVNSSEMCWEKYLPENEKYESDISANRKYMLCNKVVTSKHYQMCVCQNRQSKEAEK